MASKTAPTSLRKGAVFCMDSCKARRLLRVWRGVLLLSFLLFLSALWIGFDDLFSPLAPTGDTVEIPDLVGLREEEIAADDRFSVRVEYRHDATVPRGVILSQEPSAGARRKLSPDGAQTDLSLVVSLGAKTAPEKKCADWYKGV